MAETMTRGRDGTELLLEASKPTDSPLIRSFDRRFASNACTITGSCLPRMHVRRSEVEVSSRKHDGRRQAPTRVIHRGLKGVVVANADRTVWIVDDDVDVLQALHLQLSTAGFDAIACQSGAELLDVIDPTQPGCILLDLRMPGMSGLDVQKELGKRGDPHPVVFLSGHGDIPVAVRAVKSGAHEFLEKPVRSKKLLTVLERALDLDRAGRRVQAEEQRLRTLKQSLTRRESDVANLLLDGLRSAEIAERLQLSSRTVEMHRARLFKRLGARTTADAARILQQLRDLDDPNQKNG